MNFSQTAKSVTPSLTRQLFNMASRYDDVVDLTLGDPDLPTPPNVKLAGCQAIMEGHTRYSANAGLLPLRRAIAHTVAREYGFSVDDNEVIVTVGGMEAIYLTLTCLIEKGDEVIIPAPYWVNYVQMVKMCGGIPVFVSTKECQGFALSVEALNDKVTDKTKLIIINSPNNPTGEIYDEATLQGIADIARQKDLLIVADEVYKSVIFDGKSYKSIIEFPGMRERVILINSFSKKYSMTGWRVGYAVGSKELIAEMAKLQENVAACTPLPSQYAAIEALSEKTDIGYMIAEYQCRRDFAVKRINNIPKLSCRVPSGTFYLFVNISETGMNSEQFAYSLLEKQQVAVVPGRTYGEDYDGFIRIALTLSMDKLQKGFDRIAQFLQTVGK